jgi:hypothetical protein
MTTRWAVTEPRADAVPGSEANIAGTIHTLGGTCCERTGCLDCGSLRSRHQQPIMGGVESVCEFCPGEAHRWLRLPLQVLRRQEREIDDQDLRGVYDLEKVTLALMRMTRRGLRADLDEMDRVEKRLLLEQRAQQWAAAERAADDRAAELDRAAETLGTSSGGGDIAAYVEAQARARVAGKIEDDTREWLLEAARALLP